MNKQWIINKLKENGIELLLVTDKMYKWDQIKMARKDYNVPDDVVIPTKDQYDEILDSIWQDGLRVIMEEHIKDGLLCLLSSFKLDVLYSWRMIFDPELNGKATFDCENRYEWHIAFWKLPKNF